MNHIKSLFTAILPALFIAGVVAATTTISQNIVTDGNLTVGGDVDVTGRVSATEPYLGDGSQLSGLQASVGENLISYWKFDDNLLDTGLTQDLSLGAGTETYVSSPFGKAVDLDGSTYYTANDADYDFEHTDSFSISFWAKPVSGISTFDMFAAKGTEVSSTIGIYLQYLQSTSNVEFRINDSGDNYRLSTASNDILENSWYHLVFTFSGNSNRSGMKIYVNGNLSATGTAKSITNSIVNNQNLVLGAESDGGRIFNGQLLHIRVYDIELTANQVETLFHIR